MKKTVGHIFQGCVSVWMLLVLNSCFETCEHGTVRIEKPKSFFGVIDTIYRDKTQKDQPFVRLSPTMAEVAIINSIYHQFSKGDTLFKRAGSMKYYWIKNGDTTIFYQQCGKEDVKD